VGFGNRGSPACGSGAGRARSLASRADCAAGAIRGAFDRAQRRIPTVERHASVDDAFAELERAPAVLVSAGGNVLGVLTRSDLLDFLAHRRQAPAR